MASALLMLSSPPSSMLRCVITPSSTIIAYRRDRTPRPFSFRSSSAPIACVKRQLPSASIVTRPLLCSTVLAHAFMTKASLTETHAMTSTPRSSSSSACLMNPGTCFRLHVGVKAPGTANSTTFFPAQSSVVDTVCSVPSESKCCNVASGIVSPTLAVAEVTAAAAAAAPLFDDDGDVGERGRRAVLEQHALRRAARDPTTGDTRALRWVEAARVDISQRARVFCCVHEEHKLTSRTRSLVLSLQA
mmetsp:Transcript_24204/g.38950  ORF Transcript_24204/g.38950 Transcript_24204/m.38950 type:complete len:246 (+) Transcript_24204:512-1249(+)